MIELRIWVRRLAGCGSAGGCGRSARDGCKAAIMAARNTPRYVPARRAAVNEPRPTEHELREAFRASGLWHRGWSFAAAMQTPAIVTALTCLARARRKATGKSAPIQPALI